MEGVSAVSRAKLSNIAGVRAILKLSQREMGLLLGVSTRSIQSYEQGWRPVPPTVQKLAGLFLSLKRRKDRPKRKPCWKIVKCPPNVLKECWAHQLNAGDICALAATDPRGKKNLAGWERELLEVCTECRFIKGLRRG